MKSTLASRPGPEVTAWDRATPEERRLASLAVTALRLDLAAALREAVEEGEARRAAGLHRL